MRIRYSILIIAFAVSGNAQPYIFERTFGGAGNDFAFSVQQTADEGYIIAGQTESFGRGSSGKPDLWAIKLDKQGKTEWHKTYGGIEGDGGYSVMQTSDSGFIVSGSTSSYGKGYPSMWLIKLNNRGDTVWTRIFEGSMISSAQSVRQTSDGGYIVAGKGKENILKLDKNGNKEWSKRFSWIFYTIDQTSDGGYIAAGDSIYQQLNWDYLPSVTIVRLDRNGDKIWGNPLGDRFLGRANCIQQIKDGGYVFAGDSIALKTENDHSHYFMVCRLAGNGKKEWAYSGKEFTGAQWISQTSDDGFIVAGNAIDGQQGLDLQLVKLDKSGRKMWSKTYGKSMTWEYASCVQQTSDGGYVVSGQTESFGAGRYDGWILKTDENGNYTGSTGIPDQSKLIEFSLFQNYPNPFTKSTIIPFQLSKPGNILLKILNLSGMVVETSIVGYYPAGEFKVVYEPKSLLTGIYVYRLEVNDLSLSRIMIMK